MLAKPNQYATSHTLLRRAQTSDRFTNDDFSHYRCYRLFRPAFLRVRHVGNTTRTVPNNRRCRMEHNNCATIGLSNGMHGKR